MISYLKLKIKELGESLFLVWLEKRLKMTEPTEYRVCLRCNEGKKTTVREEEEENYYCEECLKEIARVALKESSPVKGFIIIGIVAIIAYLLGKLI